MVTFDDDQCTLDFIMAINKLSPQSKTYTQSDGQAASWTRASETWWCKRGGGAAAGWACVWVSARMDE
jgi:hypothetical protein